MDKDQQARRRDSITFLAKRQIKQSRAKFLSGLNDEIGEDPLLAGKSMKENFRTLSDVGKASSENRGGEMGCDMSDKDNESVGTSKRSKLPEKNFCDSNGVGRASVPRKLRSAIKKRNRVSLSPSLPDSKKVKHTISGIESSKKKGLKKLKLNFEDFESITKDEEEVAETLYALAGMFPNNDENNQIKLDFKSLETNSLISPDEKESPKLAFEDTKDKMSSIQPSNGEMLAKESSELPSLNEPRGHEHLDKLENKRFRTESDNFVPQASIEILPLSETREIISEMQIQSSCLSLETCTSEFVRQQDPSFCESKSIITLGPTVALGDRLEEKHVSSRKDKKSDSALCPGMSSSALCGVDSHDPSRFCAAKVPSWRDTSISTSRPLSVENTYSGKVYGRTWKRCAVHVYISSLIEMLRESKDGPFKGLKNEVSKQGGIMEVDIYKGVKNDLVEVGSASSIDYSSAGTCSNESKYGISQLRQLSRNPPGTSPVSDVYSAQKQSFDFLSLSARFGGLEANGSSNVDGISLESMTHHQKLCSKGLAPRHTLPLSLAQACHSSPVSIDQQPAAVSRQVHLQLPPSFGSHPLPSSANLTWVHQQQQQQRRWETKLAAQHRPETASTSRTATQPPFWVNGRWDSPSFIPSSALAPVIVGPKYSPISQQQQKFIAISSSIPPGHYSRVYGEASSFFQANDQLPLTPLCNEHI